MSQEAQAIQTVLNLSKNTIDAIAALTNIPLNIVEELITLGSEVATYNMLSNTNAVETRICQEFALNDFKRELIAQDIPFVNVVDENGQYLIITKKEDSERVSALADHLAATKSRKIEFTEKEFNRMFCADYSVDHIKRESVTFDNLSPEQVALFKQQAYKEGIVMTRSLNGNGTYNLTVLAENKERASQILKDANLSLSGVGGHVLKANLAESEKEIETAAGRVYDVDHDFYVVSANDPNRYLHVYTDEKGARVCDSFSNGKSSRIMYEKDAISGTKVFNELGSFSRPVIMEKEQFEKSPLANPIHANRNDFRSKKEYNKARTASKENYKTRKEFVSEFAKEKNIKPELTREQKRNLYRENVAKTFINLDKKLAEREGHARLSVDVADEKSVKHLVSVIQSSDSFTKEEKENAFNKLQEYMNLSRKDIEYIKEWTDEVKFENEKLEIVHKEVIEYDEYIDVDELDDCATPTSTEERYHQEETVL